MLDDRQTLKDFMESYEGFNFETGTIVIVKRSTARSYIIEKNSPWTTLIEKYNNSFIWSWNHTENIIVITLDI